MKKPYLLLMTLFSLINAHAGEITAVTYNIRHGMNSSNKLDLETTAKVMEKFGADVIALQEVDNKTNRSENVDQATYLGEKLKMHHTFGKAIDHEGGEYGQAILSKYPILSSTVHRLPSKTEKRIALEVVVEPEEGKKMSFVSIHLDYESDEVRIAQIKALFEALKEVKHPVILLGDFNAQPDSAAISMFKKNWINVVKDGNSLTYPADKPAIEIDYFMMRGFDLKMTKDLKCRVIPDDHTSDHRPVLLKFAL